MKPWLGYLFYFAVLSLIAKCTMVIAPNVNFPG